MTDVQKFWLSIFPGWPGALLDKFDLAIQIDAPKFGYASGADLTGFNGWYNTQGSLAAQKIFDPVLKLYENKDFNFSIGSPTNSQFTDSKTLTIPATPIYDAGSELPFGVTFQNHIAWQYAGQPAMFFFSSNIKIFYDNRIFTGLNPIYAIYWESTGDPQQSNMLDWRGLPNFIFPVQLGLQVIPNANLMLYDFVDSILAMHESGFDNSGLDYAMLYDYRDYRNAYQKYLSQIESNSQLLKQQSQAAINNYRQDFQDRAAREKADLDIKKLQIYQAIQNDQQSAQREYMTQLIAAQNLKISLQGALRG